MKYTQIRNMLDQVGDFHGQLSEYYNQLSDESKQQRVKMLLDHMSGHERNLQQGLTAYEDGTSRQVLETEVTCRHCAEILAACEQTPISPKLSVDGVTKVAIDVDNCLLRFYHEVADNADSETVREVFRNLIAMGEAERRKHAFGASQAMDI